jgi:hypothetical protein
MYLLATNLRAEIAERLRTIADAEGVFHTSGREVRYFRGDGAAASARRAFFTLGPQELTVVPPVEIVEGTWCLIL